MWYLIFIFLFVMIVVFPFVVRIEIRANILRLKFSIKIFMFNRIKKEFKVRIKNGYAYIYSGKKEKKEKLTKTNVNLLFLLNITKQTYFRQELKTIDFLSNFGYNLDSCLTACVSGYIDVVAKGVLAKIKNNKKSSHILVESRPKYNEDICSLKVEIMVKNSVFDLLYAFIYALIYTWGDYEKNRKINVK